MAVLIFHLSIAKRAVTLHLNERCFASLDTHFIAKLSLESWKTKEGKHREWIFSRGAYGAYSFVRWAVWRDDKQVSGWEIRGPLVQFKGNQA